jgi:hypothetical protein
MIVFSEKGGLTKRMGYKELAKSYLERYEKLDESDFVVNMILMLDDWEEQKGFSFDQIMPSDWDFLLKAVRVLNVEQSILFRQ